MTVTSNGLVASILNSDRRQKVTGACRRIWMFWTTVKSESSCQAFGRFDQHSKLYSFTEIYFSSRSLKFREIEIVMDSCFENRRQLAGSRYRKITTVFKNFLCVFCSWVL